MNTNTKISLFPTEIEATITKYHASSHGIFVLSIRCSETVIDFFSMDGEVEHWRPLLETLTRALNEGKWNDAMGPQ